MSRFNVDEEYVFIRLETFNRNSFGPVNPVTNKPGLISVIKLKCIEQHAVAWDQDHGEKKYEGYIFKNEENEELWSNQYPSASYGQVDDSENQRVRLYVPDEKFEKLPTEWFKIEYRNRRFEEPYELAITLFAELHRFIERNVKENSFTADEYFQWENFKEWIVTNVEYLSEKKVVFYDRPINCVDGSTIFFPSVKLQ